MSDYRLDEPDVDADRERLIVCESCEGETNRPERHHGQLLCARCLDALLDVQQVLEADRRTDEDEEGYGFGV